MWEVGQDLLGNNIVYKKDDNKRANCISFGDLASSARKAMDKLNSLENIIIKKDKEIARFRLGVWEIAEWARRGKLFTINTYISKLNALLGGKNYG